MIEVTWSWFGGFVDGEGTFYIGPKTRHGQFLSFSVVQKDRDVLVAIRDFLLARGCMNVRVYQREPRTIRGNWYPGVWALMVANADSLSHICYHLIPHLQIKREKAICMGYIAGLKRSYYRKAS